MIFLAARGRQAKADDISEVMGIPAPFLRQVLQVLQRAGLVSSRPSRSGGYALARPAAEISLFDIVDALEGPLQPGECALRGGPCWWDDVCPVHPAWSAARSAFIEQLRRASLADVAASDQALAAGAWPVPADSHRPGRIAHQASAVPDASPE